MALREWTVEELIREYKVSEGIATFLMREVRGKTLRQKEIETEFMLKEAGHSVVKKIGGQRRN